MITPTAMYWLTRLDVAFEILCFLTALCLILSIGCLAVVWVYRDVVGQSYKDSVKRMYQRDAKVAMRVFRVTAPMVVIFALGLIFLPTTKQMAAIVVIPKVVNNEKVQNIGNELHELAIDWLNELKPSKKGD